MNEPRITMNYNDIRLSPHFMLTEFLNLGKHPDNLPTPQVLFNLKYGCQYLLDPLWLSSPLHPNWVLQMKTTPLPFRK